MEQKITEIQDSNEQTAAALKTAERRLSDLALLIKHTATYRELKPLYGEYKKSRDKEKYLCGHEREIILFEASEDGTIAAAQVTEAGLHRSVLQEFVKSGEMYRFGHGLYVRGYSDRTPAKYTITFLRRGRMRKGMLPCGSIPFVAWLFNF